MRVGESVSRALKKIAVNETKHGSEPALGGDVGRVCGDDRPMMRKKRAAAKSCCACAGSALSLLPALSAPWCWASFSHSPACGIDPELPALIRIPAATRHSQKNFVPCERHHVGSPPAGSPLTPSEALIRGPVMENFSKRTTATLAAAFLLGVLGWSFTLEKMGEAAMPVAPCAHHLVFAPISRV